MRNFTLAFVVIICGMIFGALLGYVGRNLFEGALVGSVAGVLASAIIIFRLRKPRAI